MLPRHTCILIVNIAIVEISIYSFCYSWVDKCLNENNLFEDHTMLIFISFGIQSMKRHMENKKHDTVKIVVAVVVVATVTTAKLKYYFSCIFTKNFLFKKMYICLFFLLFLKLNNKIRK